MKKSLGFHLCLSLALSSPGMLNAAAGYVCPKVAPRAIAAYHVPPNPVPGVWLVTNVADNGPGSLRYAVSNAAPGNTIRFALRRLPATILLRSTLVIDKDLTILGPGPRKLFVARTFCAGSPSFRVFRVDAGVVTIAGLSIVNGRALHGDGFTDNLGGGIFNEGSLTVSNCIIACNAALDEDGGNGFGGGIFTLGPLTVLDSTIRGNKASYAGGGICTFHSDNVRIEGCTINGNYAGIQGGGVNFQGRNGSLQNSTISGNRTTEYETASALLHLVWTNEASALDLTACTIARNCGSTNGAVVIAALPGNLGSNTRMIGTLVADNASPNFFLDGNPILQSLGHNLDSDGTSGLVNGVNGDVVGTPENPLHARLSPLLNHGGPTWTHALLPGSLALDAGECLTVDGNPLATDQRGLPRPQGAACDIGAFENQPPQVHCPKVHYLQAWDTLIAVVNDPDGDPMAVVWIADGAAFKTNHLFGTYPPQPRIVTAKASLPPGDHTIGLRVSDGKAEAAECSTTVTVCGWRPRL